MSTGLYDLQGRRLYCTADERKAFLKEAQNRAEDVETFCLLLAYSGCRISEALNITPARIDAKSGVIIFETLKKRKRGIFRAVPLPDFLIKKLQKYAKNKLKAEPKSQKQPTQHAKLTQPTQHVQHDHHAQQRLWPWCRTKAWQEIKSVMTATKTNGPQATPKALRHTFAISALQAGVPLNMVSKWLGHSSLEITAIYSNAFGNEERLIAKRMWAN